MLMIDQVRVEGRTTPVSGHDEWGNQLTLRTLRSGATYEIIKNYPTEEELKSDFAEVCEDIHVTVLPHFWALHARVRARTG